MTGSITVVDIARVCHEANRAVQIISDDEVVSQGWEDTPEEIRQNAIRGVEYALAGVSSRTLHEHWMEDKRSDGWVYGPHKSFVDKTHPCMVDYNELPAVQRVKDELFNSIVGTFAVYPGFDGKLARREEDGSIRLTD